MLVPAAETQFAKDASFGYSSSNLRGWVVEKSQGTISKDRFQSLTIENIRTGGADEVKRKLMGCEKSSVVIVNAAATEDIDTVVLGVLQAENEGHKFLFRTGAAFVSSRLGILQIPPITATELSLSTSVGGLIIAGSYVPKTSTQLEVLQRQRGERLTVIVFDVPKLLKSKQSDQEEIARAVGRAANEISRGQDVLVMTR